MGKKRIALYGGTFDPIHVGHLEVARKITRLFEIDELLFVLAQAAPHKILRDITPAIHRYAMLALVTENEPRFLISTFELDAPGRCYTVDTLAHFKSQLHETADLFFIMGADSWSEISTWRDAERLLGLVNHIVVTRPGYELVAEHIGPELRKRITDLRGMSEEQVEQMISNRATEKIFITDAVLREASATKIRRAARENSGELTSMVPPRVANYIKKYGLYRDSNGRNN